MLFWFLIIRKESRKVLDGPELDEPEIFWKKISKRINEIWTVFKLINKLPNNYNFNTRCTVKQCNFFLLLLGNLLMSLKTAQISLVLFGNFFQKISGPSSSGPSRTFRIPISSFVNSSLSVAITSAKAFDGMLSSGVHLSLFATGHETQKSRKFKKEMNFSKDQKTFKKQSESRGFTVFSAFYLFFFSFWKIQVFLFSLSFLDWGVSWPVANKDKWILQVC